MPGKWRALSHRPDGSPPEVYPLDDLRSHILGVETCPCRPFWDGVVLVHQSFDGREANEPPERQS